MVELAPGYVAGTYSGKVLRVVNGAPLARAGVAGVSAQVQARSGVLGWKSLKVGTSTLLTVSITSGAAVVQGSGGTQGPYIVVNDADDTVTLTTANGSQPRKDAIVARVYDADDGVTGNGRQWVLDKVTGTPAGSPALPATPTDAILLAEVLVGAGVTTLTAGNITDRRVFTSAQGGIIPCLSTAYPADPGPGQLVWVSDASRYDYWTGSIWTSLMIGAEIAYVQDTTDVDAGAGGIQDVTNMTLSFTLPTARKVRVTVHNLIRGTVTSDVGLLTLTDASNTTLTRSGDVNILSSARSYLAEFSHRASLAAGSYTFKVRRQRVVGTGAIRVTSAADQIAWMQVVDCGP